MPSIYKLSHLSNEAVHQIGKHGLGKSKIIESFAKDNNMHIEILMLSQNEVADLIGMPIEEGGITYWSKPIWLKRMEDANKEGKHCILHLDELARAPLEVRQSALQLVLDKRIHEHHLPELDGLSTLVVASDNPADEYQTDELDPALKDRFSTYEVEVDELGWLKWARANNLSEVVTDFIADYPDKLHWIPKDAEKDKGATPRAWHKLSDLIKNIDMVSDNLAIKVFEAKLGSTVGNSFFQHYINYAKVMKVDDIVKAIGKDKIKTQENQEEVAKKISKLTREMEQISASELAQKIKAQIEVNLDKDAPKEDKDERVSYDVLTVYLASLNMEIMASIYKNWKEDKDTEDFFYEWAKSIQDRWIFRLVTKQFY